MLPGLVRGGDHIHMPLQEQGSRFPPTLQPGDQVRAFRGIAHQQRIEARCLQEAIDIADALRLIAGRVGGIEADQTLKQLLRAVMDIRRCGHDEPPCMR